MIETRNAFDAEVLSLEGSSFQTDDGLSLLFLQ
jgi:hypothetical protein